MENVISTIQIGNKTIKTFYDNGDFNPRVDCDNLGVIYSNTRNFNPDRKGLEDLIEAAGAEPLTDVVPWATIAKKFIYLKVWMYDHSGIALRCGESNPFTCPFDSGLAGVIAVSKAAVRKEYSCKGGRISPKVRERVEKVLAAEIEELEHYENGEVYCYEISDENGEVIESCGGYLDEDDAIKDAKLVAA